MGLPAKEAHPALAQTGASLSFCFLVHLLHAIVFVAEYMTASGEAMLPTRLSYCARSYLGAWRRWPKVVNWRRMRWQRPWSSASQEYCSRQVALDR
jgi:hypothetical protein